MSTLQKSQAGAIAALVPAGDIVLQVESAPAAEAASVRESSVLLRRMPKDGEALDAPVVETVGLAVLQNCRSGQIGSQTGRVGLVVLSGAPVPEWADMLIQIALDQRAVVEVGSCPSEALKQIGEIFGKHGYTSMAGYRGGSVVLLVPARTRVEMVRLHLFAGAGGQPKTLGDRALLVTPPVITPVEDMRGPSAASGAGDMMTAKPDVAARVRDSADDVASLHSELAELRQHLARVEHRAAGQIELQSLELSRLKAEMRARTDMLLSRHEALLNGRIFSLLRRLSRMLQWQGLARGGVPSLQKVNASLDAGSEIPRGRPRLERDTGDDHLPHATISLQPARAAADSAQLLSPQEIPRPQSVRIAGVSYMSRKKGGVVGAEATYPGEPLISVIMTTYNTERYVEAAIRSILEQSWRNLELVVVDDCSSDMTRTRVEAMQRVDSRIKLYCFGENNGTYFCKNFGITRSTGSIVTFMDSDDVSLPARIEKQFHALNRSGVAVSTCNHVRQNEEDGSTILINGVAERVAYISQMVKKSVIEEIGYFDTVRTSADDEFLRRVRMTYGLDAQVNVKDVLYIALLRDGSLTRDPANAINFVQDRNAAQSFLSPQRRHYAAMCDKWHKHLDGMGLRPYMPFPVVRRPYPVFGRLLVGEGRYDGNAITACMATYPPREEKLRVVVAALLPQVDSINIYLNGYDEVPAFLKHSRINAVINGPDLRDNGKFHFTKDVPDGFCFTVDDDIAYPPDYVQSLIRKVEFYERKAIVGLHGTVYAKPIRSFFRGRTLLHFEESLATDTVVNQLGTGTVAFHTDLLRPELKWFETTGMADVWLALEARRRRIPLVAIAREAHWLLPIGSEETTLFREFRKNDDMQTEVVRQLAPWREELSRELAVSVAEKKQVLGESYARLLPNLGVGDAARRA
ncbi:glycosyltransferase family A protein [Luteimonas sp. 9C]|uniref:glycosyltransferase family 2 protein n=1 Tax=Luteimonas sp. 9C TaxID=2653148 RepID=UPI00135CCE39|nr:glycosyltransferase family A protein [Luteimonas sp. 9C]